LVLRGGRLYGIGSHAGVPVIVGSSVTVGLLLNTDGGGVVLLSARSHTAVPDAGVSFASTQNLELNVNLSWETPRHPGLFWLRDIDVEYRSGHRVRHARIALSACVLAYDVRNKTKTLGDLDLAFAGRKYNDPLVARYENDCIPVAFS
jgi:hypothetical protein